VQQTWNLTFGGMIVLAAIGLVLVLLFVFAFSGRRGE
jgi:hypothetical protein